MKCFRRLFFVFLALEIFFTLQNSRATETNSVLDSWFAAQKNIKTWSADFIQTRTFKTLTQPLIGKGRVWFSAPNDFRWELGRPVRTIALRHGDEMFIIYPSLKRAEKYPMGANAPEQLRNAMSLLNAGFPRSREAFDSQYKILSLAETNGVWQLKLQPKNSGARQMMSELQIGLATNNFSLASTELIFADSSRMRNDFTNVVLNPALDKKLFEWTPPPDYQVINPFAK
ncbi:MAG: LolA family protein [Limisphaerales bacterium]